MTKKEYQKNIIRMWDSIRSDYKGESRCAGVDCTNCPFNGKVCYTEDGRIPFHAYDAVEIIEEWAKTHPVVTNADKFQEFFGFEAPKNVCVRKKYASCEECEYYNAKCGICGANEKFWNAEYDLH